MFTDTTVGKRSQYPLAETDSTTYLLVIYRYDNTTGIFTVPPGGDGFYYFSVYLLVIPDEIGEFDIHFN